MQERWRQLEDFPEYLISDWGNVMNGLTQNILKQRPQQYGVPSVSMYQDKILRQRSVPLLVAKTWLPEPEREDFISPIHLDGHRDNCHADNLMWRPRWFSVIYHKERIRPPFPNWADQPIEVMETEEVFETPNLIAQYYGVLALDVFMAIANRKAVFPQWFHYQYVY